MLKRFKIIALVFCLLTVGASAVVNSQGTMATWSNVTNTTPSVITSGNLDFVWSGGLDPYWQKDGNGISNRVLQGEELTLEIPFSARVKGNNLNAVIEAEMLNSSGKVMPAPSGYQATWQLFTTSGVAVGDAQPLNSGKKALSPILISSNPNALETGKILFRISINSNSPVGTSFPTSFRTTVSQSFNSTKITGITATVDSEEFEESYPNGRAVALVDGDINTFWHTEWSGWSPDYPHTVFLNLPGNYNIEKIVITPRQGSTNGQVKDGALYCKKSNSAEYDLILYPRIEAGFDPTTLLIDCEGNQVKIVFYNAQVAGQPWATVGEIEVYGAKK